MKLFTQYYCFTTALLLLYYYCFTTTAVLLQDLSALHPNTALYTSEWEGNQLICFTATKVQILTPAELTFFIIGHMIKRIDLVSKRVTTVAGTSV